MEFQKNTFEINWHLVKLGQNSRVMLKNHGALFLQYHRTNKKVFEKKIRIFLWSTMFKTPHESSNWLLDPVSKIKINLCTLAIDYKKILKKKMNLQLHHHNENLRPQVDMTHNNRYQNRSRTVGHKPDHPRKIIIRENTDTIFFDWYDYSSLIWDLLVTFKCSKRGNKELKPLKMKPYQRKPIWALFSQYFIVAAFWNNVCPTQKDSNLYVFVLRNILINN